MEDCTIVSFQLEMNCLGNFLTHTQTSIQLASTILDNIHIMDFKTHHVVLLDTWQQLYMARGRYPSLHTKLAGMDIQPMEKSSSELH